MNQENRALHTGLLKLLEDATFPLKAREVAAFARVYNWVKAMPDTFVEKPAAKPKQKPKRGVSK